MQINKCQESNGAGGQRKIIEIRIGTWDTESHFNQENGHYQSHRGETNHGTCKGFW